MDMALKDKFMTLWKKYFNDAPLPITIYYTDKPAGAKIAEPSSIPQCIMGGFIKVQRGESLAIGINAVGCGGGMRFLGFTDNLGPNAENFLSCGVPGKSEGERLKKTPKIVKEYLEKNDPPFKAPGKYLVAKRWDKLEKADKPDIVVFFANPDVISGLFMLAGFDETEQNTVIAPWGSGCSYVVYHPYLELKSKKPRSVIGMFDVSVRSFVPKDVLSLAIPMPKFTSMVENMEESFLITPSWAKIQKRIG
jgi:hypothetical protein